MCVCARVCVYVRAHVSDSNGQIIESQDTPKSTQLKPNYVLLPHTVHVQTSVEDILARGLCLFFEFKHYKPQKKKISTRCFALLESRELDLARNQQTAGASAASGGGGGGGSGAGGGVCLELYKKPTDFTRRSLSLFTIKQLYLHLSVQFTQH